MYLHIKSLCLYHMVTSVSICLVVPSANDILLLFVLTVEKKKIKKDCNFYTKKERIKTTLNDLLDVTYFEKNKIIITISRSTSNFNFNKLFSSSNLFISFFNFSFSLYVPPILPDSEIV